MCEIPFLEKLIIARDELVYKMQEKYKGVDDEQLQIAIQYIYGQYAVSDFLLSINNPLMHFDDKDIFVLIDPIGSLSIFSTTTAAAI